jgi:hypothetical protein
VAAQIGDELVPRGGEVNSRQSRRWALVLCRGPSFYHQRKLDSNPVRVVLDLVQPKGHKIDGLVQARPCRRPPPAVESGIIVVRKILLQFRVHICLDLNRVAERLVRGPKIRGRRQVFQVSKLDAKGNHGEMKDAGRMIQRRRVTAARRRLVDSYVNSIGLAMVVHENTPHTYKVLRQILGGLRVLGRYGCACASR